jgi:hypothetical protein
LRFLVWLLRRAAPARALSPTRQDRARLSGPIECGGTPASRRMPDRPSSKDFLGSDPSGKDQRPL